MLVGAIGFFHKYGDRTEITDKSLKGTREALERLLAYLGSSLAAAVRTTVARILANATTTPEGILREVKASTITEELNGEAFRDDIASFVNSKIDEMQLYRNLSYARARWSAWAKRISRGVLGLLILQGVFTFFFVATKVLSRSVAPKIFLGTFIASALAASFCVICAAAMQRYYDKISEYRDKIL